MKVTITNLQDHVKLEAAPVGRAVRHVMKKEGRGEDVSIAFVDNARIAELNEQFLKHAGPTDVISFNLDGPGDPDGLLGEVVVSAEMAAAEARRRHIAIKRELLLYVIHGVLHLLGYDDSAPREARLMRGRQRRLLNEFLEEQ